MEWRWLILIGAPLALAGIVLAFITVCQWMCRKADETAAANAETHSTPMSSGETTLPYFN